MSWWKEKFGETARICSERVKDYPPGMRREAFLECMREMLR